MNRIISEGAILPEGFLSPENRVRAAIVLSLFAASAVVSLELHEPNGESSVPPALSVPSVEWREDD